MPRIDAILWVEGADGIYREMKFRVDCGTGVPRILEADALANRLPINEASTMVHLDSLSSHGEQAVEARRGLLRIRFTEHEPILPFLVPVLYVLTPPVLKSATRSVPPLLGLCVADQMAWHIDGRGSDLHPHGTCVLTDVR
ncbi:MAG: hypothetical protein K2W96_12805 [Gemmataceae bacterium]|nr:hypothetical protein [Gemmataceae bacterium]